MFGLSGRMVTMAGPFKRNSTGAQIGEIMPPGQAEPDGKGGTLVVRPYVPAAGKLVSGE